MPFLLAKICLGYLELVRVVDHIVLLENNITLLKDVNSRPYGRRYRRCILVDNSPAIFDSNCEVVMPLSARREVK